MSIGQHRSALEAGRAIRVGIEVAFVDRAWIGGVAAIANLVNALHQLEDRRIEPILIAGHRTTDDLFEHIPGASVLRTDLIDNRHWSSLPGRAMRRLIGRNLPFERWLRRNEVDVFSHGMPLGGRARIPTIGHIADFGYKYFEHLYPPDVFRRKDEGTSRVCNEYDYLLLSSRSVANDFHKFFPDASAKAVILPIVPSRIPELRSSRGQLVDRYNIPGRYLYSPNQFWVHKNHLAIIEALGIAMEGGREIHVICTGATHDERRPDHFQRVMERARDRGVADRFHVLGIVPYQDVTDLMRHSMAVLSASLFEGWGISITEAKMLGKAILLSDIAVFREQAPDRASYFDPRRPDELAALMIAADDSYSEEQDKVAAARQCELWPDYIRAYAKGFEEIVIRAAAGT